MLTYQCLCQLPTAINSSWSCLHSSPRSCDPSSNLERLIFNVSNGFSSGAFVDWKAPTEECVGRTRTHGNLASYSLDISIACLAEAGLISADIRRQDCGRVFYSWLDEGCSKAKQPIKIKCFYRNCSDDGEPSHLKCDVSIETVDHNQKQHPLSCHLAAAGCPLEYFSLLCHPLTGAIPGETLHVPISPNHAYFSAFHDELHSIFRNHISASKPDPDSHIFHLAVSVSSVYVAMGIVAALLTWAVKKRHAIIQALSACAVPCRVIGKADNVRPLRSSDSLGPEFEEWAEVDTAPTSDTEAGL